MSQNLNEFIKAKKVKVYGFPCFIELQKYCNSEGEEEILSTLSPADMTEKGIYEYYYPILKRGTIFTDVKQILDADLEIIKLKVKLVNEEIQKQDDVIIVSRHQETIDILKEKFPNHKIYSHDVTENDIKNKYVVGTLPGTLAVYCDKYLPATIRDYNATEGDLSGKELEERIKIHKTIRVEII